MLLSDRILGRPIVVDALIALFLFALSVSPMRFGVGSPQLRILLAAATCVPLIVRRRHPTAVFVCIACFAFTQWAINIEIRPYDVAVLVALYTVAAYGRRRDALAALMVVLGGIALVVMRLDPSHVRPALVATVAVALAVTIAGDDVRNRREAIAALAERAERLEREREALAEVAAGAERARIVRELHDVVAHNVSVMVALADGAAYAFDRDPARSRQAMDTVAETGRAALGEMRRLLGVLRVPDGAPDRSPQPGVERIPDLVAGVRSAGLPVDLEVAGEPVMLAPGLGLTLFRLVQEALTNTLKHAGPGATASVWFRFAPEAIEVEVADDGGQPAAHPSGLSEVRKRSDPEAAGQGLVGMRERVSLYDGTLSAEPSAAGGFMVRASFPVRVVA